MRKRQELAETTPLLDRVLDCAELASTTSTQAIQVRAHASCGSEGKAKAAMHAHEGSWSGADVELKALRLQFRVGLNEAETIKEAGQPLSLVTTRSFASVEQGMDRVRMPSPRRDDEHR